MIRIGDRVCPIPYLLSHLLKIYQCDHNEKNVTMTKKIVNVNIVSIPLKRLISFLLFYKYILITFNAKDEI